MIKILLTLLTLHTFMAFAQNEQRFKGVDKKLNEILKVTNTPGFAVAVVKGNKIIYAKGFGYRDYEQKIPVDANTLFAIGSCTKAFTSTILGQLRDDNKLSLDDKPSKFVPELKFFNDEMNFNITIKDLMCHRTGLPRHDHSWYYFGSDNKDSLLARIQYHEPFTGLRNKWYYNNFMFLAQGVIAERITNKSWEDNIKERFFIPLEMNRSNTTITELKNSSNIALGYGVDKNNKIIKLEDYYIGGMSPAGSINSSVNDMSNWLITWINKGKYKNKQLVSQAFIDEAMSSQMVVTSGLPDTKFSDVFMANYGYAWMINSYKGHYRVSHGGNINGYSADVSFFPSDSIGIVVLTNQDGSATPNLVRNTIADHLFKVDNVNWATIFKERNAHSLKEQQHSQSDVKSMKKIQRRPSHNLHAFEGKYTNPGYGTFNLVVQNDSIFVLGKNKKLYLKHLHYDIFNGYEVTKNGIDTTFGSESPFNFQTNQEGNISAVQLKLEEELNHPLEFIHQPKSLSTSEGSLNKYVGNFEIAGAIIKIYTKNDNTLFLFIAGQPEYELIPTEKHIFSLKNLNSFKVEFLESSDKSIQEIKIIQPNGTFMAKRK